MVGASTQERTWVGRPLRRVEDRRLVTGGGVYVDDVQVPTGRPLAVAFVRSPHPHARVQSIDISAARALPGVRDVVVGADTAHLDYQQPSAPVVRAALRPMYLPIATDTVRYVGEIVAAVLAEDPQRARDAADLVEVEYDPLPGVSDPAAALEPGAPLLHPEYGTNEAFRDAFGSPADAVDAAFAAAEHVTTLRIRSPRLASVPIEPRVIMAQWDASESILRVWPSTQRPFGTRGEVASVLGLDPSRVHVVARDVGGGFGTKGIPYREEAVLAYFAYKHRDTGPAVRWTSTRSEDFQTMLTGRDQVAVAAGAFDRDGTLRALRVQVIGACGAYLYGNTPLPIARAGRLFTGAYRVPLARGEVVGAFTNTPTTGPYRGAGRPEGALVAERIMDVAARELGLDPVEMRRKNLIPPDAFPYPTPTGVTYDSGNYEHTLDVALEMADYPGLLAERDAARARGDLFGVGVCVFVEPSGGQGYESGAVRVEPDGSVTALSGAFAHGQGHLTTFAQVVADRLQLPIERVTVVQGDTRVVPEGVGTFGSRSTMLGGSALAITADRVLERMKQVAAHMLEAEPTDVAYEAGRFTPIGVPSRAVTFDQVAAVAWDPSQLPADFAVGLHEEDRFKTPSDAWPHGTHVVAVRIDRDTGRIHLERYVAVDDAGVIVNPLLAAGQVMGGLAQGIGQALLEQVVFDEDGTLISGSLGDYAVPRAADLPTFLLGETVTPTTLNPLGAKGVGEGGTVGAPPAVVNAVIDALWTEFQIRELDMPLTPERVWAAMQASRQ